LIEQFAHWVCFGEWPMKKIIKLRSKMICSAVVALSMALPGLTHAQILFSQKNETSAKVLQQHLLQERNPKPSKLARSPGAIAKAVPRINHPFY
jgi:hypothetical protein